MADSGVSVSSKSAPWRIWRPILAGATLRDRLLACLASILAIGLTGLICALATSGNLHIPLLVAPMGASAVLVFAVPASPLAQPWPTVGGNVVSAAVGLTVAHYVPDQMLAAGIAVGLAIAAMSFLRCLHPPGGAAALVAVFGGTMVDSMGFLFPLVPVGINAVILVAFGWAFHRLRGKPYPHTAVAVSDAARVPPALRFRVLSEDIDQALEVLDEGFDISRDDLTRLIHEVEKRALVRSSPNLTCADIMTKNVVTIDQMANPGAARDYLLKHDIRTLPVVDGERRLIGCVSFRSLLRPASHIKDVVEPAVTATPETPAMEMLDQVSDGRGHAVMVVDHENRIVGIITQTDILAALSTGIRIPRKTSSPQRRTGKAVSHAV